MKLNKCVTFITLFTSIATFSLSQSYEELKNSSNLISLNQNHGFSDMSVKCDLHWPRCRETRGFCRIEQNSVACKCLVNATYHKYIGCKVSEDTCDSLKPKCIVSGGSCTHDQNRRIFCSCRADTVYETNIGCKASDTNCKSLMPRCIETGGYCMSSKDKRIMCYCRALTAYYENIGCKLGAENQCKGIMPNCIETGGYCLSDQKKNIVCSCPANKIYDNGIGCKEKPEDFCEDVCGKDPAVTCNGDKTKREHITCDCVDPRNFFDEKSFKCENFDEVCNRELPYCLETQGACTIDRTSDNTRCDCLAGMEYSSRTGCVGSCLNVTCFNGGLCKDGKCLCLRNFKGDKCEIYSKTECEKAFKECAETNGTCVRVDKNIIKCDCPEGTKFVTGKGCESPCLNVTCFNGGSCKNGKCECVRDFKGDKCEIYPKTECEKTFKECAETKGTCVKIYEDITRCDCPEGAHFVTTKGCKGPCLNVTCFNGGSCKYGKCECVMDFTGDKCEIFPKSECEKSYKECAETRGTCVRISENMFRCDCPEGTNFVNNKGCEGPCLNVTCFNGGLCKYGKCECILDFKGDRCERFPKLECEKVLKGCAESEGTCVTNAQNNVSCDCPESTVFVHNKGCNDLISMEDGDIHLSLYFHNKNSSMSGTKFDFHFGRKEDSNRTRTQLLLRLNSESVKPTINRCNCENGKCKEVSGKTECTCYPEYAKYTEGVCKACECGKGVNCIFTDSKVWPLKTKTCICPKSFFEVDGICVDPNFYNPCLNNPCKNGARCEKNGVRAECVCLPGYSGEICQYDRCSSIKCQNGGKCNINDGKAICECDDKYVGDFCELDKCSLMKCLNGGKCEIEKQKTVCVCDDKFTGDFCEKRVEVGFF